MGPTRSKPQVCVDQRDNRSGSHSLQTKSTWDWTRGTPTTQHEVCTAGRNKKHRIPHKALEANIWQQQLWGVILHLGIWTQQVWKRQQHPTTTPSQDCSLDVWNKRTTTTTPSFYSWSDANLHWHQSNHHGILQDNHSIQQAPAERIIQRCNKLRGAAPMDIGAINKEKG